MLRELGPDGLHRLVQIDRHRAGGEIGRVDLGQEACRVGLELFEEDPVGGDLGLGLTIGRAAHGEPDRQRGAVARQPDHANVVAEVLAAELGPDAERLRDLQHLGLHLEVSECMAAGGARGGQGVVVAGRCQLGRLDRQLGRRAADDQTEVVRRAGRRAEQSQLLVEEAREAGRIEQRFGLLEQVALVGRAAALGHEHELVRRAGDGLDLDFGRQVGAGVLLLPHGQRGHLGVAEVRRLIRVEDAGRDRHLVVVRSSRTYWPFLPFTIAVPVSWQPGRTNPAAMLAFSSSSVATKTSLDEASGSSRMLRQLLRGGPGGADGRCRGSPSRSAIEWRRR